MKNGVSILIVDDEPLLRDVLTQILTREGFQVEAAVDGDEALEKMAREKFPLVVSDIQMPRMNGQEGLPWHSRDHDDRLRGFLCGQRLPASGCRRVYYQTV